MPDIEIAGNLRQHAGDDETVGAEREHAERENEKAAVHGRVPFGWVTGAAGFLGRSGLAGRVMDLSG
ncbi:hypothetical protein [Rhizobium sp. KDH_Rht_773_N]